MLVNILPGVNDAKRILLRIIILPSLTDILKLFGLVRDIEPFSCI